MSTDLSSVGAAATMWQHGPSTADWRTAHAALVADDKHWTAAPFAGFQVGAAQLLEMRHCPCCFSTLNRPIRFAKALKDHAERMAIEHRAGTMLAEWAAASLEDCHAR